MTGDSAAPSDPDWLSTHRLVQDAKLYLDTVLAFSFRPRRFAREWAEGKREAMNPLTMVALASGALATIRAATGASVAQGQAARSFWMTLAFTALPYLHYVLMGAVIHALIGGFRAGRPRLRSTVAMMLYAGSGPYTVISAVVAVAGGAFKLAGWIPPDHDVQLHTGPQESASLHLAGSGLASMAILGVVAGAALGVLLVSMTLSVAALHRVRIWKVALTLVAAFFATGLLYGALGLPRVEGIFQPVSFTFR